jgi:hypothetical protein
VDKPQKICSVRADLLAPHFCRSSAAKKRRVEKRRFRGDKPGNNGDYWWKLRRVKTLGTSSVIASRSSTLLIAALLACAALTPLQAQWWSRGPADFEECADKAEKAAAKEEKTSQLAACNAKFAGRRKAGGGYTYFDFMQNRSFDIAGPNPTPEEQKKIDDQYTAFLDQERRNRIAAAFTAKQQLLQKASFQSEKVPLPVGAPNRLPANPVVPKPRPKITNCARDSFSCEWPRLSESLNNLKRLLSPATPNKPKHG